MRIRDAYDGEDNAGIDGEDNAGIDGGELLGGVEDE